MNAEDAGPHVSYYGRLIKQPLLCGELGKPQESCRWNTYRIMMRNVYFLPPGKDEVIEAGQSLVIYWEICISDNFLPLTFLLECL